MLNPYHFSSFQSGKKSRVKKNIIKVDVVKALSSQGKALSTVCNIILDGMLSRLPYPFSDNLFNVFHMLVSLSLLSISVSKCHEKCHLIDSVWRRE